MRSRFARAFAFGFLSNPGDLLVEAAQARFDFGKLLLSFLFVAFGLFEFFYYRGSAVVEYLPYAHLVAEDVNEDEDKNYKVNHPPQRLIRPDTGLPRLIGQ